VKFTLPVALLHVLEQLSKPPAAFVFGTIVSRTISKSRRKPPLSAFPRFAGLPMALALFFSRGLGIRLESARVASHVRPVIGSRHFLGDKQIVPCKLDQQLDFISGK
jgi:hypothetical protein